MKKRRGPGDTNRSMSQKCNSRGFYCDCDLCIVQAGQRCPACGQRNNRKKLKPQHHGRICG